jgi:transcriptional regulator with XRE-family HTH domain
LAAPLSWSADIEMAKRGKAQETRGSPRMRSPLDPSAALLSVIAANLKRLRTHQGHSLERLAKIAGVSRAMLSQIETGKSVPTISLLLKIANALGVPIANLLVGPASRATAVLPRARAKVLISSAGRFSSRALFPLDAARRAEFYEVRLLSQHRELIEPRATGARENLVVVQGKLELTVGNEPSVVLPAGDAAAFLADVPRSFRNLDGGETVIHIVVMYAEPVGQASSGVFSGN